MKLENHGKILRALKILIPYQSVIYMAVISHSLVVTTMLLEKSWHHASSIRKVILLFGFLVISSTEYQATGFRCSRVIVYNVSCKTRAYFTNRGEHLL